MNIAYVSADRGVPVFGRSGSSTHLREFVTALAARGVGVSVLAACVSDGATHGVLPCPLVDLSADSLLHELRAHIAKELRAAGRATTRASETYSLLLNETVFHELTRLRGKIDLVYERHSLWSFAGMQFAKQAGLPFFLEVNAPLLAQQQEYRDLDMAETARALETLVFSGATRVIVTSPALREYAQSCGASRKHIRVIPCGVSREMFADTARPGGWAREEFVVGFVGSLKPWHGVEILMETFLQLSYLSSRYRLLVVGDGPLMPQVEAFCRRHNLTGVVTLAGGVDHKRIPEHLARIDVGLAPYPPLPSFYFSPLKVWEYAAAGVPIVASASGGLPELFPHKSAALLHPPGNLAKIVKHVELLRRNPDLGRRLARRARRIAKLHTWDRLAARFESLAADVVRARPTSTGARRGDRTE
jgi:glycosyltransferase involved in cell wall biosynthesis